MIRIIGVGDIMPGGVLNKTNKSYVSKDILEILSSGDIRVGTLETAIGNEPSFYIEKMKRKADVIYAEDEDLKRLVELNINVVSLANNHFFDLGPEGAQHTIDLLDKLGIKHCGGGKDIEEASKPVVEIIDNKTIAFLAFCDWRDETTGWCPFATASAPGVNPMYDEYVVQQIQKYKSLYDYVVVIPHWGVEYRVAPTKDVYSLAKRMVNAGADLILGGHTHCVQPTWKYKGKQIVFSMGNFLFPDRLITKPRSTYYSPEHIDLSTLPVTDGYPYVEEVTYKIWKPIARYGMVVAVDLFKNKSKLTHSFTHLTSDNYIELQKKELDFEKKLNVVSIIINSGFYLVFNYFISVKSALVIKIKKLF